MYTNPLMSAQAKVLRRELQSHGLALSHAQALELVGRLDGSRTLHVAQSRTHGKGVEVGELALRQASDLMFERLGRYAGDVRGLLAAIEAAVATGQGRNDTTREALSLVFGQPDAPVLSAAYEAVEFTRLPELFEQLVQKLEATLRQATVAPAPADNRSAAPLYLGPMLDWRISEGTSLEELPQHHRQAYEVRVQRSGHQFYVDIAPPHRQPDDIEGQDQMSLFIEVNEGRPCVHVSNDCYGDQVLTVFATADGLYLRPEDPASFIRTGHPAEGTRLAQLYAEQHDASRVSGWNTAFMPTARA